MGKLIIVLVIIVGAIAIAQLMRVYELSRKLRGDREENISHRANKFNANLWIAFMIFLFGGYLWLIAEYAPNNYGLGPSASQHGEDIDWLMDMNFMIITVVFFLTNTLLFVFARKYYYREDRKAYYYPHNNKLELLWTVVPSLVLAVIIILGLSTWNSIMFPDESEEATTIELYSQQFQWTARYSGENNELGSADYKLIMNGNLLGVITSETLERRINDLDSLAEVQDSLIDHAILPDWQMAELESKYVRTKRLKSRVEDLQKAYMENAAAYDSAAYDDKITKELHLIAGETYDFIFRSQDVIHSAYFPHFRAQMNTVPGMRTSFRFKPTITTDSMRQILNNPTFDYWLLCNKICGQSHYNMKMKVIVEDSASYYKWFDSQKTLAAEILGEPAEGSDGDNGGGDGESGNDTPPTDDPGMSDEESAEMQAENESEPLADNELN